MAFEADISKIEKVYSKNADAAFALCFLSTGQGSAAFSLMRTSLCDMTYSKKRAELVNKGDEGFFRAVHLVCTEFYEDNPRKRSRKEQKQREKAQKAEREGAEPVTPAPTLPFSMSDPLRRILKLSPKYKTALYLMLVLGWNAEKTGRVINRSERTVNAYISVALEKTRLTRDTAKKVLLTVKAGDGAAERVWDRFLVDRDEKDFAGKQRFRLIKRGLDRAIPYIACGAVAIGVIAFCGVEFGWFTGTPYSPTQPSEGYEPSDSYLDSSSAVSEVEVPTADISVFVPQDGGYTEYIVRSTPLDISDISRQMVYLGALPEGVSALSVDLGEAGNLSSTDKLSVELSAEAAEYMSTAENAEEMLCAIAQTYAGVCENLKEISIRSGGAELSANGKTAQDFINEEISPSRTVETDYRK